MSGFQAFLRVIPSCPASVEIASTAALRNAWRQCIEGMREFCFDLVLIKTSSFAPMLP